MSSGIAANRKRGLSKTLPQPLIIPTQMENLSNLMHGIANAFSSTATTPNPAVVEPTFPNPQTNNNEGGGGGGGGGEITCWLIDTRPLWPGKQIWEAPGAAECMSLISMPEQKAISTKMFIQDARMSLASALIKRLYLSKTLGIAWKDVKLGRKGDQKHGKPCAVDEEGKLLEGVDFNVSHQAGLVALVGWDGRSKRREEEEEVMVGVDIVCVNERDDYRTIDAEGIEGWVDIYDFVFSFEERWSMKWDVDYVPLEDGTVLSKEELGRLDRCMHRHRTLTTKTKEGREVTFSSDKLIDAKLRRFYTYFCYKEAYIKLAGEALLAPWLKNLEFHGVRSPKPVRDTSDGKWGEVVEDVEVHLHKKSVEDVRMKIVAFEKDVMLSTALQGKRVEGLEVPEFEMVDLRRDVLSWAKANLMVGSPVEQR